MIVGTGVDIMETSRVEEALQKHGERFAKRVCTPAEIAYCGKFKNQAERLAARFAAKEAAFKALGTGWREGVRWVDVEITHSPSGKPELIPGSGGGNCPPHGSYTHRGIDFTL